MHVIKPWTHVLAYGLEGTVPPSSPVLPVALKAMNYRVSYLLVLLEMKCNGGASASRTIIELYVLHLYKSEFGENLE
jgi:hypothetical protein